MNKLQNHHSVGNNDMNLEKVDFVWVSRDQKSFEWFVKLLLDLESQQLSHEKEIISFHMYITSASDKSDIRSLVLQLALEMMREKTQKSFITGLRARTNPGRPDWDKVVKFIIFLVKM